MADDDNDFVSFTHKTDPAEEPQQWRVVSKISLHYSEQNGNEPDNIFIMQPVLSGFEMVADDAPKAFAVLEEEFDDIFQAVE